MAEFQRWWSGHGGAGRAAAVLAAALVIWPAAARAQSGSLVYTRADGNVYLSNPDGTGEYQVTLDGSASSPYNSPSQADDGTILVERDAGTSTGDLYRLGQNGAVLSEFQAQDPTVPNAWAPSTPPTDPRISPDGRNVAWVFIAAGTHIGETSSNVIVSPSNAPDYSLVGDASWSVSWMGDSRLLLPTFDVFSTFDVGGSAGPQMWFDNTALSSDASLLYEGALSPDGTRLAVAATNGASVNPTGQTALDLFATSGDPTSDTPPAPPSPRCGILPPDGGTGRDSSGQLPLFDSVSWSPDSSAVAFGYNGDVYVATIASLATCDITVTKVISGASDPDWGPAAVNPGPRPSSGGGGGGGTPGGSGPSGGGGTSGTSGSRPSGGNSSSGGNAGGSGTTGHPQGGTGTTGVAGVQTVAPPKPLTEAQKRANAIAACNRLKPKKRARCIAAAKRRYPLTTAKPKHRKRKR